MKRLWDNMVPSKKLYFFGALAFCPGGAYRRVAGWIGSSSDSLHRRLTGVQMGHARFEMPEKLDGLDFWRTLTKTSNPLSHLLPFLAQSGIQTVLVGAGIYYI